LCPSPHGGETCADLYAPAVAADGAFRYEPASALLVVDVQNDFAAPNGSLAVADAYQVVTVANREISAARAAGAKVVYSQDWHPPLTPHFTAQGGRWPQHCVQDTWGAAFHPDLLVAGEVVRKGTGYEDGYSAFTVRDEVTGEERPTRLVAVLGALGLRRLAIVGLATDYCVRASALDALGLGWQVVVLSAGVGAVNLQPGDGDRALVAMAAAGAEIL
jgi:nicotinamidase/pyrazinamidase